MLKKLCALIMAFVMTASLFAVGAAASYDFQRGDFRYFIDGEKFDPTTDKVAAGETVTGEVAVQNLGDASDYATIITALYDARGRVAAVARYRQWIGKQRYAVLTTEVAAPADDASAQYDVKSFVWQDISTMIPCGTVVTEAPDAPTGVTVTKTDSGNLVAWGAVSTEDIYLYGYNVYRDGTKIATVTDGTGYTDSTATTGAEEYTVTALGFNESAMSETAEVIEYVTATLDMDGVADFFTNSETLTPNGTYESYNFGELDLYVTQDTIAAYDKDFITNKTDNTFGFATITDSDGVSKSCLATNNLQQNKFMIEIPADSEVLTSATKTITITVLDNSTTDINFRYFPTTGSRADLKFKRTNSGKWVTLSATVNDSRMTNDKYNQYHFELGRGANDKYGEVYIADIEISAPKTTAAE